MKSDEELITEYNELLIAQDYAKFDLDILIMADLERSEFLKEYNKLNENLEEVRKELISRGIIKNRVIIPTFE